jgi:hypothetical protein
MLENILLWDWINAHASRIFNDQGEFFMKRLLYALVMPCFLFSLQAFAQEDWPEPQTQGDVTFVSGGIGEGERNAMEAMKSDYNLNLLFAAKGTGEFLADVNVRIADAQGNTVIETVSDGPFLFARLKPGNYTVLAEKDGSVMRQKARVGGGKRASLSFYWPL